MKPDEFLLIGYIAGAFGVRGQVRLKAITDQPEHLAHHVHTIYIGGRGRQATCQAPVAYHITDVFLHKPGQFILTLKEVTNRTAAEALRQTEVFIHECEAVPLSEGEYYLHQLYNLRVQTTDGVEIGQIRDVLQTGANDVIIVERPGQSEVLIPMIRDVIEQVDVATGQVVIRVIPGLLS